MKYAPPFQTFNLSVRESIMKYTVKHWGVTMYRGDSLESAVRTWDRSVFIAPPIEGDGIFAHSRVRAAAVIVIQDNGSPYINPSIILK